MIDKSLKEIFEEQAKLAAKARQNPFKHRWKLDDPEFVQQRKRCWPYIKKDLEKKGSRAKELKQHKAFFMEGEYLKDDLGVTYLPDVEHALGWTPCANESEMQELIDWLISRSEQNVRAINFLALVGRHLGCPDAPFGFALGNELLISRTFLGDGYNPDLHVTIYSKVVPKFIAASELIKEFELRAFQSLMNPNAEFYRPLLQNIDFYLSCIRHIESEREYIPDRNEIGSIKDFSALISAVFHFVEPGQTGEKPPSKLAKLASGLKAMFLREDVPAYLKKELAKMPPSRLIEYKRIPDSENHIYVLSSLKKQSAKGAIPMPRVLRGAQHESAFIAFQEAWIINGLLSNTAIRPRLELVNSVSMFPQGLLKDLGYDKESVVPAWRHSIWYTPDVLISNSGKAKFGCDLFFIVPKSGKVDPDTTSVFYFPRVNEHFSNWFPTSVLMLKERQVRRTVWEKTGCQFLQYGDRENQPIENYFMDDAKMNTGYPILDIKLSIELFINGFDLPLLDESIYGLMRPDKRSKDKV